MGYLKSVDRALEQSKDQVRLSKGALGPYEHTLPQLILPDERLAMDGLSLSPELLSCQVRMSTNYARCLKGHFSNCNSSILVIHD